MLVKMETLKKFSMPSKDKIFQRKVELAASLSASHPHLKNPATLLSFLTMKLTLLTLLLMELSLKVTLFWSLAMTARSRVMTSYRREREWLLLTPPPCLSESSKRWLNLETKMADLELLESKTYKKKKSSIDISKKCLE